MSSSKKILRSDLPMKAIQALRMEIFGETPFLTPNNRSSARLLKKTHTGPYLARYYPETIDSAARKATPGYKTELQERRERKALNLRRRGKGAPKKGAGKRQQKK